MNDPKKVLEEARAAREQARLLLRSLLDAQTAQNKGVPVPKDLFKRVTGQSSLDNAIVATRRLVETYDRMIGDGAVSSGASEPSHDDPPSPRARVGPMTFAATYAARIA
ncbi:hypothetical protein PHYC_03695 [Phycisphaerales bacterium]|nr:hypothetical protein PHYC_03695 [Phycisphaerales bacterium]